MRIHSLLFLTYCVVIICAGCGERPIGDTQGTSTNSRPDTHALSPPHHSKMEVLVNIRTSPDVAFANKNGCSSNYSPKTTKEGTKIGYGLTCGHPGAVSKVSWDYTHSDEDGDHYHFERLFPHEEPSQKRSEVDVVFNGSELVLFKDKLYRIVLRTELAKD